MQFREPISQLKIDLGKCAGLRAGITLRISRAVIGAAGKRRDLALHQNPVERKVPQSILDHYGRTSLARAIHLKVVASQVDKLSGGEGNRARSRSSISRNTRPMIMVTQQTHANIVSMVLPDLIGCSGPR